MNRPRLIKGLRIAWTAAWGIVCVLLVMLWVRSNWRQDVIWGWLPYSGYLQVNSYPSVVVVIVNGERQISLWQYTSFSPEKTRLLFSREKKRHWYYRLRAHKRYGWWLDINVPHWFLVLLVSMLAAIPWIHWSKRFTLKTMLIATTLIAIVLGLVVWSTRS